MTNVSVPSTLVKCLYLFFDLPPISSNPSQGQGSKVKTTDDDDEEEEAEFTPKERRILLQKMFIQVRETTHSASKQPI